MEKGCREISKEFDVGKTQASFDFKMEGWNTWGIWK